MAKTPAFQFYPMDWQRDLDEHSLEIEGAWIRICCRLWWAKKRGELTLRPERWATILRKDVDCTNRLLDYLLNEGIASGKREANGYITLISRRMVSDDKAREYNRIRQQRFYHKDNPNAIITKPNAIITPDLTPTSQRSSSSSSTSKNIHLCPHKEIVQTYNEILGSALTPVKFKLWHGSQREKYLQARWRENEEYQNVEFWKGLFEYIRDKCPFLMGTNNGSSWKADLGWIIKKENFIKTVEGKYEQRKDHD